MKSRWNALSTEVSSSLKQMHHMWEAAGVGYLAGSLHEDQCERFACAAWDLVKNQEASCGGVL